MTRKEPKKNTSYMGKKYILCFLTLIFSVVTVYSEPITNNFQDSLKVDLEEVVVNSFKYGSDIFRLPVAGLKIDRLTIENQNIVGIKDISSLVPNVFMPDYGSKARKNRLRILNIYQSTSLVIGKKTGKRCSIFIVRMKGKNGLSLKCSG